LQIKSRGVVIIKNQGYIMEECYKVQEHMKQPPQNPSKVRETVNTIAGPIKKRRL